MNSISKLSHLDISISSPVVVGKFAVITPDIIDLICDVKDEYDIFEDIEALASKYKDFKLKPFKIFIEGILGKLSKKSITETTALSSLIDHCFDRSERIVCRRDGVSKSKDTVITLPIQKYHKKYVNDIKKYRRALSFFNSYDTFFNKVKRDDLLDLSEITEIRDYFEKLESEIVDFHTECLKVAGVDEASPESSLLVDDIIRNELYSYIELIDDAYFGTSDYTDRMKLLLTEFYDVLEWISRRKRPVYSFEVQVRMFELIINQTKRSILNRLS